MRSTTRFQPVLWIITTWSLSAALALGGELPPRFTLGKYIPDDVWFYAHGVHNPERAWIEQQWAGVFDALKSSGIDRDITSLLRSFVPDPQGAEATFDRMATWFKRVRWGDLFGREAVFVERLSGKPPAPHYVLLTRGNPGSGGPNTEALVGLLEEIAALSDKITLTKSAVYGADVWTVETANRGRTEDPSVQACLFRKADVIGVALGFGGGVEDILALIAGKSEQRPIVDSPRFKEAVRRAETPEDYIMFLDVRQLFRSMRQLETFLREKHGDGQPDDAARAVFKVMELTDVMDYVVMTMETEGRRELKHTIALFQPGKETDRIARLFLDRRPFDPFDQYLPQSATGFALTGFIDLEQLYDIAIEFVQKEIPGGVEKIERWNSLIGDFGFDPKRDLFSWWSGEIVRVTLPAAASTPMGGADSVFMVRVKDSELARQKVGAAVEWLNSVAREKGQMLIVTPAQVDAEGFREFTHPLFVMFMRPVIGVKDGWLFMGTSAAAINKCLDVAAGKAPSIVTQERFRQEGLIPAGPVLAVSFEDMTNLGDKMASLLSVVGMGAGFFSAQLPTDGDPKAERARKVIQAVAGITMKLSPVLREIDFYSSSSSVQTVDGVVVRTEAVVTYKPPPPRPR